jgi:DNA polymerase-4
MDAFFASVEQLDQPALRGKPVLVGHEGLRGVVTAASYEARKFGCHSAQPMATAKRLCPHAIVVPTRFHRYIDINRQLMTLLDQFSPLVEPISIDEAFVDLTGTERLHGPGASTARKIKDCVRRELQLTCSIGLAANKFLAKLASDLEKPDGLTIIGPEDVDRILPPLAVTRMWGVGPKTGERLARHGINTFADLRAAGEKWMKQKFGSSGAHYFALAHGLDKRAVTPDASARSIGHEQTFGVNLIHLDEIRQFLLGQVEQVAARVRRHGRRAGCVVVKIRFGDFQTITRSQTLAEPTDETSVLWSAARELLESWATKSFSPVRLIGVHATSFADSNQQLSLFSDKSSEKRRRVDRAVDAINEKLGDTRISRGGKARKILLPIRGKPIADR